MSVSSFNSMKYLKACVMETFRMYPTADQVMTAHKNQSDMTVSSKSGQKVVIKAT